MPQNGQQYPGKNSYRTESLRPLALGLNDAQNPLLLSDGETPDCRDVDFNYESIQAQGGALKFNNQPCPHAGLLTTTSMSPLYVASGKSVPQRGYGFIPYSTQTDLGGDFNSYQSSADPTVWSYHAQRGRSFNFSISFALPKDEKLYVSREGAGVTAPIADVRTYGSYDEALDECTLIAQKGGDGLSPFSIGLGIVNTAGEFETVTGLSAFDRVSNYALCFMWFDAPGWGQNAPGSMRYKVSSGGANVGTAGRYCTMALRALIAKVFVEPGVTYHVSVNLSLDTGSPGSSSVADPTAAWNSDGSFQIVVKDERGTVTSCGTLGTDLFVWKGPSDSYDYLTRYGVRFSGRDPMFLGLGMRFAPHSSIGGFIPLGLDSAPMEKGGFRMLDVSSSSAPSVYPTHTCTRGGGTAFVDINRRGMTNGGGANGVHPYHPSVSTANNFWAGLYDGSAVPNQGTAGRSEALRGYWLTLWGGAATAGLSGARLRIDYYFEQAGNFRFAMTFPVGFSPTWAVDEDYFVIAFRWFQRPLHLSNFRIWNTARTMSDARTRFSLSSYSHLDDATEPNIANLVACWPLDDAGGGLLRETVNGRSGYLAPYMLGQDATGLFLSGEGEAPMLDFSANPILKRELESMLSSGSSGFAIEMRVTIPQAYYALMDTATATTNPSRMAPVLAEWAVKDDTPGNTVTPAPILRFGHRCALDTGFGDGPFFLPMGFNLEVATDGDQVTATPERVIDAYSAVNTSRWSTSADWVGREIRLQFGVQSTGNPDEYTVYIAASPKTALFAASGDPVEAEFAYYATKTIYRRNLARSVVVIGGCWRPESFGYLELGARLIVHEARVFGCAAPGKLPSSSGGINTNRDGKLLGDRCLPARDLLREDLLQPLTPSKSGVNVTDGSASVTPSDASRFFEADPENTLESVKETFLLVGGDGIELLHEGTEPTFQEEFYYIASVASGGATLTLGRNFNDKTRSNAYARSFRVIGYSSFDDDIARRALPLGRGSSFTIGALPSVAVVTEGYWDNLAPCTAPWVVRVFATQLELQAIAPRWSRGLGVPRKNPVLGVAAHEGRLFATARGSLFEVDDRWRLDGPNTSVAQSLAFRADLQAQQEHALAFPLQCDRTLFGTVTTLGLTDANLAGSRMHFDCWLKIEEYAQHQTVLWVGNPSSNPGENAGTAAGTHHLSYWIRLTNGYPEFVIGSTAAYTGVTVPDRGLYVATGATRIPKGLWTHLRFTIEPGSAGYVSSTPYCFVNGKRAAVSVNATQTGAPSGSWMQTSTIGSATTLVLGAAHDSFSAPTHDKTFVEGVLDGVQFQANRYHGWLHALGGLMARVAISRSALVTAFDPHSLSYSGPLFLALDTQTPVGHKVLDSGASQYGLIESHPAISLFHEMGMHDNPASWAPYENRLVVTTGGRPVYAQAAN